MEETDKEFSIYKKSNQLIIKNNNNIKINNRCLVINQIKTLDQYNESFTPTLSNLKPDINDKIIDALGIIGIIQLIDDSYLIAITKAELICRISRKEKIYKVLETKFISFSEDIKFENLNTIKEDKTDSNDEDYFQNQDNEIIKILKEIFINGFYFSNSFDLANSLTSQNQIRDYYRRTNRIITDYDCIVDGNKNFLANWKLTDNVISSISAILNKEEQDDIKNIIHFFFSNCIYGNIEHFNYEKLNMEIILISRRYLWNFGIFNYRKGLSKYGGNSNQIETELILIHNIEDDKNRNIYSNIHLSSYLPIYFKEKKNTAEGSNDANKAFIKYLKSLMEEYNLLFLFVVKNVDEDKYIKRFRSMLDNNKNDLFNKWKYYFIDTEKKTIKDILTERKKKRDLIDFVGFNNLQSIIFNKDINQIGIFSLLGMDDKTLNQNQFYLIYDTIYHILKELNKKDNKIPIFLKENITEDLFKQNENETPNQINEEDKLFINNLKQLFSNRIKELTKQYYINSDDELTKRHQRIYEMLFEKNMKFSPFVNYLKYFREDYYNLEKIKVFVGTWNTGCTDLNENKNLNLDSWLIPKDTKFVPDIYFIGLQEVVDLKINNFYMTQEKQKQILNEWDMKIRYSIEQVGKYACLSMMNLVGINFYCYVLEKKLENITNLKSKKVKTGLGGTTGNKGSCCINFNYKNTSISVGCSHLTAGPNKSKQRIEELSGVLNSQLNTFYNPQNNQYNTNNEIIEDILDIEDNKISTININQLTNSINSNNPNPNSQGEINNNDSTLFKDSDVWIFFGDLNFRVDMNYEEFSKFITHKDNWNKLLEYDQFIKLKEASFQLTKWIQEDEIKFPPTYKYIKNSNNYDYISKKKKEDSNEPKTSGKKRNPSWCDRIFYKRNAFTKDGKKIITGKEYMNVMDDNFQTSDHRPVYNIFDIIIFKEDKNRKDKIEREILQNEKLGISNKYMKKKKYDY